MSGAGGPLPPGERSALLARLLGRGSPAAVPAGAAPGPIAGGARDFATLPAAREIAEIRRLGRRHGVGVPLFAAHDGVAGGRTSVAGRELINFSSYNYLGLNGDGRVHAAASAAMARHGVSASASRLVSGERPIHRELERALAENYAAEEAVAMVSGHATNVTVIGCLLGPGDLVVHDQLAHNSCTEGIRLSGARRLAFAHDDWEEAGRILAAERRKHGRALLFVEGHYSMDGTVPELARHAALARRHDAWLMVDEAHALGVVGRTGRGSFEERGVDPGEIDIWMGTLSKSLCACGGYIAGSRALVDLLRHHAPGFVYSVGLAPPLAAAALTALRLMRKEPWRVEALQRAARRFRDGARRAGFDVGTSAGLGIVPVVLGGSLRAVRVAERLLARGVNAQPIAFPVVPEGAARLRFFLSAEHGEAEVDAALAALAAAAREAA